MDDENEGLVNLIIIPQKHCFEDAANVAGISECVLVFLASLSWFELFSLLISTFKNRATTEFIIFALSGELLEDVHPVYSCVQCLMWFVGRNVFSKLLAHRNVGRICDEKE